MVGIPSLKAYNLGLRVQGLGFRVLEHPKS